jgi:hypothetical protein
MAMDPVACGHTVSSEAGSGFGFGWGSDLGPGGSAGFDLTESRFENGGDRIPELNRGSVRSGCRQHSGKPDGGSWLDEALDRLPAGDRALLLGRFFEKRGFRELSAELGKSEAALRKQSERALAKLRARLQSRLGNRALGQGAVAGLVAVGFSGKEAGAAVGKVIPGFSVSAPLPTAWAVKAVAAAVWSPSVAAPGTTGGLLVILTFMSTPKATFSAAVVLCLLIGTSAWLQLENSAQAEEISRLSRRAATVPTVRKSPPGSLNSVVNHPGSTGVAVSPDEVPPSPLTGAALVKAWQRTQSDSLYDPGYTLASIASIWEAAPEEDWARLLREVDAASASALARSQTAAALLNGWSSRNPPWVCEELLRRKSVVLRYSIRKWASADRDGAWRWIQEKTASGELPDKGIGGAATAAAGARRDFADSFILLDDDAVRDFVGKQKAPDSRSMLLKELSAAFLAQGCVEKNLTMLAQWASPEERTALLSATAGNIVDERGLAGSVENFQKLLRNPGFPAGQQQQVVMSGLSRVEPETMDAALVVLAAVSAPDLREANLAWLAEEFARRNPSADEPGSRQRSYAASDQALADDALAATAGALAKNGNPGMAAAYAGRIRDASIRETAMAAVNAGTSVSAASASDSPAPASSPASTSNP